LGRDIQIEKGISGVQGEDRRERKMDEQILERKAHLYLYNSWASGRLGLKCNCDYDVRKEKNIK